MYYAVKINGKEVTDFRKCEYEDWEAERVFDDYHVLIRNSFEYWEEVNNFYEGVYTEVSSVEQAIEYTESDMLIFLEDAFKYRDEDEVFYGGISFVFSE